MNKYKFGAFDRDDKEVATFDSESEAWEYVEATCSSLCVGFSHSTPYLSQVAR